MERDSFVFYKSFFEAIENCPVEQQRDIYRGIVLYALFGTMPEFEGVAKVVFTLVKPQIDANNKRFLNGKKGGAPKGNQNARKQPKTTEKQPTVDLKNNQETTEKQPNVNVNVNDNVNGNGNVDDNSNKKLNQHSINLLRSARGNEEEDFANELLNDTIFWEQTAVSLHVSDLGWKSETLKSLLPQFVAEIKAKNDPSANFQHFRNRAFGWLRSQSDYARKNQQKLQPAKTNPFDDYIRKLQD